MLLFIANNRNTVILAIIQCNNLKPSIQTFFSEWCRRILASEVASSNTVANVTITKFQQHILNSTKMTLNIEQPCCLITNTIYSLLIPILFMVASSFTVLSADFILILINHLYFFHKNHFLVLLIY